MSDSNKVRVFYHGPFDSVYVPAADGQLCEQGKSIEVDSDLADVMCQQDIWKKSGAKSAKESE